MEQFITNKSIGEFLKTIPAESYDLVSDFGQYARAEKEKEWAQKVQNQKVYFDESEENLIHRI